MHKVQSGIPSVTAGFYLNAPGCVYPCLSTNCEIQHVAAFECNSRSVRQGDDACARFCLAAEFRTTRYSRYNGVVAEMCNFLTETRWRATIITVLQTLI